MSTPQWVGQSAVGEGRAREEERPCSRQQGQSAELVWDASR